MTAKTDREVIEDALALIEPHDGWTQGTYCRDADGAQVNPVLGSPGEWVRVRTEHIGTGGYRVRTEAGAAPCKFCLEGSLRTAAGYWQAMHPNAVHEQVDRLERLVLRLANSVAAQAWPSLRAYNDDAHTTKADAVLVLKRAAAHLDAQEPKRR
ncbi:hypothetical protein H7J70_23940 [Mycolicibacterium celeriflavum]|nr:hypothetical protein [Mycolicibacterium celeriflavum]ORA45048.1 hypothetical protein BST21_18515 [Mycolicibacterium celeriflavum]